MAFTTARNLSVPAQVDGTQDERAFRDAISTLRASAAVSREPGAVRALEIITHALDTAAGVPEQSAREKYDFTNSSLDLDAVLQRALSLAIDVIDAERGFIVLRDGRLLASVYNTDCFASLDAAQSVPHELLVRMLDDGEAIFWNEGAGDHPWRAELALVAPDLRAMVCMPLEVRGESIGVIYLDSRKRPYSFRSDDRAMLLEFAAQAALAIDYARMFEEERDRVSRITTLQAFQTRILEAIASGIITLSPERIITTFNRSAETTFGRSAFEMIGRDATAIAELVPDFPELLETFLDSGAVQLRAEVEVERSARPDLTLEIQLAPLDIPQGLGVAIVVTDVTKLRHLQIAHEEQVVQAGRIVERFSRYVAPHVVERLVKDPGSVKLGGERLCATMLFADIRGFTSLAKRLPAERVVEILNDYFEGAVRIVFEHDGLLDKFYGDGLMAVFGPPRVRSDDARRAVSAAIRLHEAVSLFAPRLDHSIQISIGLATGEVVAGHIGSTQRMDYTVIGDAVNLASGLQAAAPPGTIYCDERTIELAGEISVPMERRTTLVKGRDKTIVYALRPPLVAATRLEAKL